MSVTPGYDFGLTEEVTAAKLSQWLFGATLDAPINLGGLYAGTGYSLAGGTNEGDIAVNFNTGKVYVKSRWGEVPLMGGGMFSKRISLYHTDTVAYRELAFYTPYFKLGPHGGGVTQFSITPEVLENGISPENSYCYAAWHQEGGGKKWILNGMTIWPSAELDDPNYSRTMPTSATTIHPTFCIMGLTPMYGTVQTAYTGQRPLVAGASKGISWNSPIGFYDQYTYYTDPITQSAPNFTPANTGASYLHWGFTMPFAGTASARGINAFSLRI